MGRLSRSRTTGQNASLLARWLMGAAVLLLALIGTANAQWTAQGRRLDWRMTVSSDGGALWVDGRPAHEVTRRIDPPGGRSCHEVGVFVLANETTFHTFVLSVDSRRLNARRDELRRMLRTLRYVE